MYNLITPISLPEHMQISINVSIDADFLSTKSVDSALADVMQKMANEARDFWVTEAGQRLNTSRMEYINAISVQTVGNSSFTLELQGALAYAVEEGTPAYDINVPIGQVRPLNVDRKQVFSNPTVFRTGNGTPWKHPGFPGLHIINNVTDELENKIIPKYVDKLIEGI